jgi:ribosomal protein S18 acetylase RimI-like enzyme
MAQESRQTIRAFRPGDRRTAVNILIDSEPWKTLGYTESDWQRVFDAVERGQGRDGFILEMDGTVGGLAVLRRRFLLGDYLELLAVAPSLRGRGIGRALLTHIETQVFAEGKNLFACVSDFNGEARYFYRAMGYEEVGPLPDLLVAGRAEILLRKTTGPAR